MTSKVRAITGMGASLQRGFTLIEIMVVVIIIGLLAAVVVPQFLGRVDDARIAKAKQDVQALETGLTMYKLDNFSFPTNEEGLKALVEKPNDPNVRNWRTGGYLKRLPKDPWGNDYQYQNPGTHGEIDLYSFGADGQAGGEGVNADIGNWNLDN
ncbi:MAG TPA: type II secretion system major pseudopilin GspG [Steroidobacteraceae bacterium]|jgi:general secretion pathway protein G